MAPPQTPRITITDPMPAGVKPTYNPSIINVANLKKHRKSYPRMKPIDLVASILHKVDPKLGDRLVKGDGSPNIKLILKLKGSENEFSRDEHVLEVKRKDKVTGVTTDIVFWWPEENNKGAWRIDMVAINDDETELYDSEETSVAAKQVLHAMVEEKIWADVHSVNYCYRFSNEASRGEGSKDVERAVVELPLITPKLLSLTPIDEKEAHTVGAEGCEDDVYYVSGDDSDGVVISSPSELEVY